MPDDNPKLVSPWKEFLAELDAMLSEPLVVHCIGGFVVTVVYGLPRQTGDIDYYTAIPHSFDIQQVAGPESSLAKKHKVSFHRVTVNNMPDDYETRLSEIFPGGFASLQLCAPDPYDYILSKLERNSTKDRDDADYLFKKEHLDSRRLRERYEKELRPYLANEGRHDLTLELWIEIFDEGLSQ
jgi:Nucleotidyltransferase of unknown function (DUF6036)